MSLWNDGSGSLQDVPLLCSFLGHSDGDLSVQGTVTQSTPWISTGGARLASWKLTQTPQLQLLARRFRILFSVATRTKSRRCWANTSPVKVPSLLASLHTR